MNYENDTFRGDLCKRNAIAFFKTAQYIENQTIGLIEDNSELMVPFTVNVMFACELMLKYLLYCNDSLDHGHNINSLYIELAKKNPELGHRIELLFNKYSIDSQFMGLDDVLSMCKENFNLFRYVHEGDKGILKMHVTAIPAFFIALLEVSEDFG